MTEGSAVLAINPAKVNPFSNHSNVALADAMGDIDATISTAQKRQKLAREEMTRRKAASLEGVRFVVTKATETELRFDSTRVKAEMGEAWYAQFRYPNPRTTYTVTAKPIEQLGVPA